MADAVAPVVCGASKGVVCCNAGSCVFGADGAADAGCDVDVVGDPGLTGDLGISPWSDRPARAPHPAFASEALSVSVPCKSGVDVDGAVAVLAGVIVAALPGTNCWNLRNRFASSIIPPSFMQRRN